MFSGLFFFTFIIVSLERYQLFENSVETFIESKKSKNKLLIDTISPIISLNISLGLDDANVDYLDKIAQQNSDIELIKLTHNNGRDIYYSIKSYKEHLSHKHNQTNHCSKDLLDTMTDAQLGTIDLYFYDKDYQLMLDKNFYATVNVFLLTLFLLVIFVFLIKREFKDLKYLSRQVLDYDPKQSNFKLSKTDRKDEVGIIHNAIISMIEKINYHTKLLDEVNHSLEIKVKERTKELEQSNKKLEMMTLTDPLTQLANRRYVQNHSKELWNIAKRGNVNISIVMCDIDHFKKVNDENGHVFGDFVLKELSKIMKSTLKRESDFIARYGGEEFVIILYDTNMENAENICKNIQLSIKEYGSFAHANQEIKSLTMSFGVSCSTPKDRTFNELINLADNALYKAKENGRNCIFYEPV